MKIGSVLKKISILAIFLTIGVSGATYSITTPGSDVSVTEGNSGSTNVNFTVTLSASNSSPCARGATYTVKYSAVPGTAFLGEDYGNPSGSGTISITYTGRTKTSGSCSTYNFSVPVYGDKKSEPDEYFTVQLSNADSNTLIGTSSRKITIKNDDAGGGSVSSDFEIRYKKNIKGNMKIIGNTVLARKDNGGNYLSGTNATNSGDQLRYVDVDSDSSTFNSSLAVLSDSAILTPTAAKVKWAGLYWTGYLHTYDSSDIDDSAVKTNTKYKDLTDYSSIHNVIQNHAVTFKIGNTSYNIATHTVLGEIQYTQSSSYEGWSYGCFAEVTDLMQGKDPRGQYTVANIPSMEGATNEGTNDVLGNSGAWTLVVIYENDSAGEKTRNTTVFDGFVKITSTQNAIIDLSGFKTPKSGNVDSTLSVFASEGDRYYTGDQFIFKSVDGDKAGLSATLSSSDGSSNYFNSSITGVNTRTPNIDNNNGIDIHTDQVGTSGYNIVSTNQTTAQIKLTSSSDVYYPVMVGFATELYMPKLCYDYSALLNGELMQKGSMERTFIPHKNDGNLQSKVFIRSLEGDFAYVNSSLKAKWVDATIPPSSNPPIITFSDAMVQNPDVYAYEEADYINIYEGEYYIGTDRTANGGQKGTIDPYKSLYAISNFDTQNLYGSILKLEIEVKSSLALDETDTSSLTDYDFSTSDGTLEVCPGTLVYNPMWYQFNVEKYNSAQGDYALNTQVTGTDYNLQVVAYTKDGDGKYTIRTTYTGAVEVEPFELSQFESLGSYDEVKYNFDRICEDSSSGKAWNDGQRHFSYFNNARTTPLGITAADNKYAMRNTGIRMWVLIADYDGDGELDDIAQNNNCVNTTGTCFRNLYANDPYYKTTDNCVAQCGSASTDELCYQCMRKYFSKPICSRDNFSVRPYGIELTAKSTTVDIQKNDTLSSLIHNLISGLLGDYTVDMVAKSPTGQPDPTGYYFRRLISDARDVANNLFDTLTAFFGIKFDNEKVNNSGDVTKCADSTHKRFDPSGSSWILENDNVGNYDIILVDKDWTLVDQARYPYKTKVSEGQDDCVPNSAVLNNAGLAGCDVKSYEVNGDAKFNKIPVKFVPASIDIQSMVYGSNPAHTNRWAYMNRLGDDPNMGARFAGNIQAKNNKGDIVSNFTAGCAAQNVALYTQYSSTQLNEGKDVSLASGDGTSFSPGEIYLHYAQSFNGGNFADVTPVPQQSTSDTTDGTNFDYKIQSMATKDNFLDGGVGSLLYDIRYNIYKLYNVAVEPIKVLFVKMSSFLVDDSGNAVNAWKNGSSTNTVSDEIRFFNGAASDVDNNSFRFLYGRVYTSLEKYGVIGKSVSQVSTSDYFDAAVYSKNDPSSDIVLKDILGNQVEGLSGWYLSKTHSANSADGQIDNIAIKSKEKSDPTISKQTNIYFDRPTAPSGMSGDITYSYNGERSNKVVFQVYPTIWLKYNKDIAKNGISEFTIDFVKPGYNWVGKGNTGNVIDFPITPNAKYR